MSWPDARYFVTCCAVRPTNGLTRADCATAIGRTIRRLDHDGDVALLCATVMPDHVHLLVSLGGRLPLGRVVAKLKGLTASALCMNGARWQENFFEHRLRPEETSEPYARYVFMNPFHAGLAGRTSEWPHWLHGADYHPEFLAQLVECRYPPGEWLREPALAMGLSAGDVGQD